MWMKTLKAWMERRKQKKQSIKAFNGVRQAREFNEKLLELSRQERERSEYEQ
jgi:hypothetical protein